jgi:DNA-binding response OmpR family regulator
VDSRLLILVVDDDPDTRESLAVLLRVEGHEVVAAADGDKAVLAAFRERPDVVLLGIGLDGYEVGRRIKESRPEKPPFVVAVTGWPEDPVRRAEAGIDLLLMKPVDPEELRRVLGRFGRLVEEPVSVPHRPLTVRPRRQTAGRREAEMGGR